MDQDPAISQSRPIIPLAVRATLSAAAIAWGMDAAIPQESAASPMAVEASSRPPCPDAGILAYCRWEPVRDQPLRGFKEGSWRDCISVDNRRHHRSDLTCDVSKISDRQVTASVTGDLDIGIAKLSAFVGYEAKQTTEVTGSISYPISRRTRRATIQFAPQFGDLSRVTQAQERCINERNMRPRCSRTGHYAVVFTERYDDPIYRLRTYR